jgi:excinuclease ABC subunit A
VRRLTGVAGPSGAGKTALVLDSLIPAAKALLGGSALPGHVRRLDLGGIRQVIQVDASPIGLNARSTPATYSGAFDQVRRVFAESGYARRRRWKPGHFSFNTREGQCPVCRGLGDIDLDVQYLPDITVRCPACHGARFNDDTLAVTVDGLTIADVLGLTVDDALGRLTCRRWSACSTGCWRPGPRSSSSTTTWTCSPPPTTSSTWDPAAAPTAAASWPSGRRPT